MMRTGNNSSDNNLYLQTDIVYFSTSITTADPGAHYGFLDPSAAVKIDIEHEEIFLVSFILLLWIVVLRIFFQRWGKMENA